MYVYNLMIINRQYNTQGDSNCYITAMLIDYFMSCLAEIMKLKPAHQVTVLCTSVAKCIHLVKQACVTVQNLLLVEGNNIEMV